MTTHIKVHPRFEGPTDLSNGGYVAGRLAQYIDGTAEVSLRRPIPLSQPLRVEQLGEGVVELTHRGQAIAEARPSELDLIMPARPTYEEATAAASNYAGFEKHTFPKCFVCGPQRHKDDGLHIYAGPIGQTGVMAAPWIPHDSLANDDGFVRPEFYWAALDCPGYFAAAQHRTDMVALLGRITARTCGSIKAGERCVVMAWALGSEGRKHFVATALINEAGVQCGIARATWIELAAATRQEAAKAAA